MVLALARVDLPPTERVPVAVILVAVRLALNQPEPLTSSELEGVVEPTPSLPKIVVMPVVEPTVESPERVASVDNETVVLARAPTSEYESAIFDDRALPLTWVVEAAAPTVA